ncbi:MAG: metal ABC transporter solute-binding protein, Zn/Mn family [Thiotrichales bacterium]
MIPRFLTNAALALLLCSLPVAAQALSVVASMPPHGFVVERVAGPDVEVSVLIGAGHNPHAFEPTARQIAAMAEADLYYRSGMPLEDALLTKIRSVNPALRVLDAREALDHEAHKPHQHAHQHDDHAHEPHHWTDPLNVVRMAEQVSAALAEHDPGNAERYRANAARLIAELRALDADLRALLQPLRQRVFLVYHPAWDHFAARYGLEQLAMEHEGKAPGPRHLARLIDRAKALGLRALFVQPQIQSQDTKTLAEAIGASLVVIDPLAADYIDNLRRVAQAIADAGR